MLDQGGLGKIGEQDIIDSRALYFPMIFKTLSGPTGEKENSLLGWLFEAWR